MDITELSSAFLIGHDQIDEEHLELVEILNDMAKGLLSKDIAICEQDWKKFCEKLAQHNINEAKIMEEFGFDSLKHQDGDKVILLKIIAVGEECANITDWRECFYEMRHQFLSLILKHDLYFAEHLVSIGYQDF